jgi:hypothetical protein
MSVCSPVFPNDLFVHYPVGTMLQSLFCYCIDFEEEIPCSREMKEVNAVMLVGKL